MQKCWILAYRNIGILAYRNTMILAYRNTGILAYRNTGILGYRNIGILSKFWRLIRFLLLVNVVIFIFRRVPTAVAYSKLVTCVTIPTNRSVERHELISLLGLPIEIP